MSELPSNEEAQHIAFAPHKPGEHVVARGKPQVDETL